mmetsp:Transcript_41094/g.133217  ORF Transcript_41094/g.133217 Transcript_41094/m.133217 type:complete len:206 (+) Transcript_41094:146-763(+)
MMTSSSSSATTTPDPAPPLGSAPAAAASPSATLRRLRLPSPSGESSSAGAGGAAAASSAAAMKRKPLGCSSLSSSVCVSAILHLSACVVSSTSSTTPGPSLTGRLSSGLSPCNSPSSPPPSSSPSQSKTVLAASSLVRSMVGLLKERNLMTTCSTRLRTVKLAVSSSSVEVEPVQTQHFGSGASSRMQSSSWFSFGPLRWRLHTQ